MRRVAVAFALLALVAGGPCAGGRPPFLPDVRLGAPLRAPPPPDAGFPGQEREPPALGRWLDGTRPALLSLVYYGCPMLCSQVSNALATSLRVLGLEPGKDFDILTVSFDPRDGPEAARTRRAEALARYGRPDGAAGWHF